MQFVYKIRCSVVLKLWTWTYNFNIQKKTHFLNVSREKKNDVLQ